MMLLFQLRINPWPMMGYILLKKKILLMKVTSLTIQLHRRLQLKTLVQVFYFTLQYGDMHEKLII